MESGFEAQVLAELAALRRELRYVVDDLGDIKRALGLADLPDSAQSRPASPPRR